MQHSQKLLLIVATMALVCCYVSAYSLGAPGTACDYMRPWHRKPHVNYTGDLLDPQSGVPHYTITASKTSNIKPGERIMVTIQADSEFFKGFIIQARGKVEVTEDPYKRYGTWTPRTNLSRVLCDDDRGLTHAAAEEYDNMVMWWTAPNMEFKDLQFKATIVKNYATFYTNVRSAVLNPDSAGHRVVPCLVAMLMSLVFAGHSFLYL